MRPFIRSTWARLGCLGGALAAAAWITGAADAQPRSYGVHRDGSAAHIDAVLHDPEVVRHIRAWGLTVVDVRHDIDAMPPAERAQLALQLHRRWRATGSQSVQALQAQFLVTMSLMRESTLFASVASTQPARWLR